jgi:transcription-repair coupling factor (superfamily II helicase)
MARELLLKDLPLPSSADPRVAWAELHGAGISLAVAEAAARHKGTVCVVAPSAAAADRIERELEFFGGRPARRFPDYETLPYEPISPPQDLLADRLLRLYQLARGETQTLVVEAGALLARLPPPEFIVARSLSVAVGDALDHAAMIRRLTEHGYLRVEQVAEPGEFAVRGALLDVFPMGSPTPYRIELFDDEIESIRTFDPETQRSNQKVDAVRLLPAREFPLTEESAKAFRNTLRERFPIDPRHCPLYQDIKEGATPAGIEYYLPLFFKQTETLFDYLSGDALFVLAEGALDAADAFWTQTGARYEQRAHDVERPVLPPAELYLPPQQLREYLNVALRVDVVAKGTNDHAVDIGTQPAPDLPLNRKGDEPGEALRRFLASYPGHVLLAADSAGRREALIDQLAASRMRPATFASWQQFAAGVEPRTGEARTPAVDPATKPMDQRVFGITVAPLEQGFALTDPALTVLTERELYGERAQQVRRRKRAARDPEAVLRDLSELVAGAPIVHIDHGVGRYQGLIKLDVGGRVQYGEEPSEFLAIEYARGDKLYVPVAQLHLVSRYSGTAPELAPLHALGGDAWERAKKKAAQKVRDVAAELLAIYAQREARQGTALAVDHEMAEQFAAAFPFEETPDQATAIEAVIADLAAARPMDRVVCGDVGFGKTEVALRAAFVAATAGKQVAVLAPTTLLAQQHYQNFRDRYADWPIRVEVLSRFKSKKEIDAALAKLADGQIDVIIGTHKLVQPDVRFKDLGLVIIDEEQRFGVRQKEALKKLRAEVDLLTLTATPIPRTLNMAMAGLRDLSIIATPPAHRLAVQTFIGPYDTATIREAMQREHARGGQVYFLHNDVETIDRTARELAELMPDARIRIAHGQMPDRELELIMLDFYRQRFNVLVATTIIESGIDVPSANTIVINRADRFGLAQLHQLRGRVGRSHHRAYAYLMVPEGRSITADAEKRREALASLDELGAGFTLATHDLEIRGAGELLGEEQSGQIEEVGFSLYTEMLDRAVRALKQGKVPDFDLTSEHETEVELHLPALIPDDYLPDVNTRLTLYKRIASARNGDELGELQVEMIDRFGLLPDSVKHLFAVTALKLAATPLGIRKLEVGANGGRVIFRPQPAIEPLTIIKLIQSQPRVYALDGQDKLKFKMPLEGALERLRAANDLLVTLGARRAA